MEARYWESSPPDSCRCLLCPRKCLLSPCARGVCGARENRDGELILPYYGAVSSIALDPIEKKPLREFLPGSLTFSVGFWHCTMACPFCQNWEISQPEFPACKRMEPGELVKRARASGCPSMAFTYSEPCLHAEYIIEAMDQARAAGLKTVLVTNGNLNPVPAFDILSRTDAVNVDLKTSDPEIYRRTLGGDLDSVKAFIATAAKSSHLEVTSLLVPGILDKPRQMEEIADFLSSISPDIPLHITPYHPAWKYREPPLSRKDSELMARTASKRLSHLYFHRPFSSF